IDRAARRKQVGENKEATLFLPERVSLLVALLVVWILDLNALLRRRQRPRMQVSQQAPDHFCRRSSQAIAFRLVSARLVHQLLVYAGTAIELLDQRREVENVEQARGQIIRTRRRIEARRRTKRERE